MANREISIYRSVEGNEGWFEQDVSSVLNRMIDAASDLLGDQPGNRVYLIDAPQPETKARRVGRIFVEEVDDDEEYVVSPVDDLVASLDDEAAAVLGTATELNRQPTGDVGRWVIQAVIFSQDTFTLDQAREWIANNDNYGDFGFDETDTAYHFRQYDRKWFDLFRIITVDMGVSEVYAQIAETEDNDLAQKAYGTALEQYLSMQDINRMIATKGLGLLIPGKDFIEKDDTDNDADEEEERFILGLVLEPTTGPGVKDKPDTQDDVYTAKTIRVAAHGWMEFHGHVDLLHNWEALGKDNIRILESYIVPATFTIGDGDNSYKVIKGTWLVALRVINDDLWTAIKAGDLGAYSIGGVANRTPLES